MLNVYKDILILGKFGFFVELFAAALLLMRHVDKRSYFPLRVLACAAVAVPLYFMPSVSFHGFGLEYIIALALIYLGGLVCFKIKPLTGAFFSVGAFAMQHLAWNVLLVIFGAVGLDNFGRAGGIAFYFICYALVYTACAFVFPVRDATVSGRTQNISLIVISALIMICVYVLSSLLNYSGLWNIYCRMYAVACCTFALSTQFGLFRTGTLMRRNEQLQYENLALEQLLYQGKKQQELSRETVQIIETKCHDLKNQISVLRKLDKKERDSQLDEIEKAVMIYGDIAKTGNDALDIVLTEKSLLCEKHKIKFTYIVDSESLASFNPVDISFLFGNILDNAIESISEESEEKRIIKLNVATACGMLRIHAENYCGRKVVFSEGLPLTNKEDKVIHGFGVKSIRYFVEKNNGNLVMSQVGDIFSVNVLLPIAQEAGKPVKDQGEQIGANLPPSP